MTTHKDNSQYGTRITDSTLNINSVDINALNTVNQERFTVLYNLTDLVNGTRTVFALTERPDADFLNSFMVFQNGILQQASTYTLYADRTGLEFLTAPAQGVELILSYIKERT